MLKKYFEQIKHNRYLRRTTFLFAGIGLAAFIVFTLIIIGLLSSASRDTVSKSEYEYLQNSCNTGDLIMRTTHSQMTSFTQNNTVIQKALTDSPYPLNSVEVTKQLNAEILTNSLIHSMYVVNFKYDTIYSTTGPRSAVDDFFDQDAIELAKSQDKKVAIHIPRQLEYSLGGIMKSFNLITCIYECTDDYAFIVNLDGEQFAKTINFSTSNTDTYRNIITTRDGMVLSDSNNELFDKNIWDADEYSHIFEKTDDFYSAKNGDILTFARRSTQSGCYYIRTVDESSLFISYRQMLKYVLIFAILLIIAYFFVSMYCTRLTLKPIYNIKNTLSEITNYNDPDNEIKAMQGALKLVAKQNIDYQTLKHNMDMHRRKELVNGLITGAFSYDDNELNDLNITIPYKNISVIILRIDNGFDVVPADIDYIKYGIINIAEELFEKHGKAYFVDYQDNDVCGFVSIKSNSSLLPTLTELQKYVSDIFNISLTISYDSCDNTEDLVTALRNARYAASFRITMGHGSIITYTSAMESKEVCPYPSRQEKAILASIKTYNKENMISEVHSFTEKLANADYNVIVLYVSQLVLAIHQLASPADADSINTFSPLESLSRLETLKDFERYIINIGENKALSISTTKTDSKKTIIVDTIVDYIDSHYKDPQLSIDMIATEVSRSANYTRSIFKQVKDISISEYIQQLRFNELCRLLKETNLPAQELGKQVGLSSGSYFYTAFKKYTGYTPEQYRTLNE